MTYLVFYKKGEPLFRYPITKERLSIGRDHINDVVLTDKDISRLHCEIYKREGKLWIKDASINGTLINSKPIKEQNLGEKDQIRIGEWTICLEKGETLGIQTTVSIDDGATKIISYDTEKKVLISEVFELAIKPPSGKKTVKRSRKAKLNIGSSDHNDLVIDDDYVSKKHCKLYLEDGSLFLIDLGSTNGTFYEGEKIDKISLPKFSIFRIGKTEITLKRVKDKEKIRPAKEIQMGQLIGASDSMKEVFSLIQRVAPTDATVFIAGESGTGKELVAISIHDESNRHNGPFVAINCGAIPPNIIESELFGHEKGAFTGASQVHRGVFEQADGGTLFLDEVGEMPPDLQTRLLRALETKSVKRIGGHRDIKVDVRIISATNQNVKQQVLNGKFREDLFFRLFIIPIHLAPLRERKDDIEVLARHFTKLLSTSGEERPIGKKAMELLVSHSWAGNVRELRNTIQRAVIMNRGRTITASDICLTELRDATDTWSLPLISQEKEAVVEALRRSGGNQSKAAHMLGIARTTLANKIKKYEIDINIMKL